MEIINMRYLLITLSTLWFLPVFGQQVLHNPLRIEVGDVVPNFKLNNLLNFSESSVNLSQFRGKAIIIDFWEIFCMPCISELPVLQKMQEKFPKDLQIITVSKDRKGRIDSFYRRTKALIGIDLVTATGENKIFDTLFPHKYIPHQIWIDKNGILRAVTGNSALTDSNVLKLITGKQLNLPYKNDGFESIAANNAIVSNPGEQLIGNILDGKNISSIRYQSLFSGFLKGKPNGTTPSPQDYKEDYYLKNKRFYAYNVSPIVLYKAAFGYPLLGMSFPSPRIIFQISDSIKFKTLNINGKNPNDTSLVCYSLIYPKANSLDELYEIMKNELQLYFGILGRIEKRKMKCYALKLLDSTKLIPHDSVQKVEQTLYYVKLRNSTLFDLINVLSYYNDGSRNFSDISTPILDETNYRKKVSLEINARLNDLAEIRRELQKCGLDVIEVERFVDVLVLSDDLISLN